MSLTRPRKEIPIAFLNLYEVVRQKEQKPSTSSNYAAKVINQTAEAVVNASKLFLGQSSDRAIREKIKALIMQIKTLTTFEDHIRFIYNLGDKANEAQREKLTFLASANITAQYSLLYEILHAIRSYIVASLSQEDCVFHQNFVALRHRLSTERDELQEEIIPKRHTIPTDVSDIVKARNERIKKLAYLDDPVSIGLLIDYKLLPELPRFEGNECNMIPVLQQDFHKVLYENTLQSTTQVDYDRFCERAVERYQAQVNPNTTGSTRTSDSTANNHAGSNEQDDLPGEYSPAPPGASL